MAMNHATQDYLLPCGRDVELVWDRLDEVDAGRADAHELGCPHCRATQDSLRVLRGLTRELVDDDTEPSADLTGRIMSAIRAEVRRRDLVPLASPEPGEVRVSDQAVAAVLRFAADSVDGVRARHCRVHRSGEAADSLAVHVELSLAIAHDFDGDSLDVVRERVTAAAGARVGLRLARLDLVVEDIYDA
ncbi:Asp23/Gls24 family envelope stress response protein [Amycolatopsis sp. QT-25]|uniref:Asp23/Gls24 family envelope stress response protein n=1 Tax=Amycolatopsis sp. QT-25 TaxID=3034022 RepID=UPI0023EADF5A|nr:Asp23/Gls24 family envelope stress response protein [Amycolatopsis sp. QT-25]WET81595.1 Asp23/Gls24 family envelope stress response protein [Amycolatopsis sp. QT-25]